MQLPPEPPHNNNNNAATHPHATMMTTQPVPAQPPLGFEPPHDGHDVANPLRSDNNAATQTPRNDDPTATTWAQCPGNGNNADSPGP